MPTMRRYVAWPDETGGRLELTTIDRPDPQPGELLVRVHSAGINNGDVAQRRGMVDPRLPAAGPRPIGMEVAGTVETVGDGVAGWEPGQRVMGRCWGGYADFAVVRAAMAMPVPASMSWGEAASTPIAFVVAHDALVTNAELQAGESVCVNAASSGIGVATLQIASYKGAGTVIGATTSPEKLDRLRALGMSVGVDARDADFAAQVRAATAGEGVDIVIDNVGGAVFGASLDAMSLEGRLVSVGRLGGTVVQCDLDLVAMKRIRIIGVSNRTRTPEEQAAMVVRFQSDLGAALASGQIRPVVEREFPLADVEEAHDYLSTGRHVGKLVLTVEV